MRSIKKIEKTIKEALEKNGTYEESMDQLIYLAASALRVVDLANDDIKKLDTTIVIELTREGNHKHVFHPTLKGLNGALEMARRLLRELGLTLDSAIGSESDDVAGLINEVNKKRNGETD